jgi:hypothetical protein
MNSFIKMLAMIIAYNMEQHGLAETAERANPSVLGMDDPWFAAALERR